MLEDAMHDADELLLDRIFVDEGGDVCSCQAVSERIIPKDPTDHLCGLCQAASKAVEGCRRKLRTRVEREKGLQGELDASNERKKSLLMSHDTRESEHDDHREQRRHERKQGRLHWTVETFRMNYDTC